MNRSGIIAVLLTATIGTASGGAPLRDAGSLGETVDVTAYVERLKNSRHKERAASLLVREAARFPIVSPGIEAAEIVGFDVDLPQLHTPLCVVGFDELSQWWIHTYHQNLIESQATCVITNVETGEEVAAVKQWLQPVMAFAAPVNQLFEPISLSGYPVIISRRRVEQ